MSDSQDKDLQRESILLRVLWMLLFVMIWQVGAWVLGAVVLVQLIYRLVKGVAHTNLTEFGASLSEYLAQIGRFGSFATEQKPWPFAPWPQTEAPAPAEKAESHAAATEVTAQEEPKL